MVVTLPKAGAKEKSRKPRRAAQPLVHRSMRQALRSFGAALALVPWFVLPAGAASLTLFDGAHVATVVTDGSSRGPLTKAAELLAHDLTSLTGKTAQIATSPDGLSGPAII